MTNHTLADFQFAVKPCLMASTDSQRSYIREPVLRRMPDGALYCTFLTGGPTEPHDENVVVATRSEDDGATWSPLKVIFSHPTRAAWATELFVDTGPPRLFVHTYDCASDKCELRAFQSLSQDSGRTWSEPQTLPGGVANLSVRQGVVLASGAWLFPVYWQEQLGAWSWKKTGPGIDVTKIPAEWPFRCGVLRTTTDGAHYTLHGHLCAPGKLWEPNVIQTGDGRILMLIRADKTGVLYQSWSDDDGLTWTPAVPSTIPNPGSKITLLRRGNILILLGNQSATLGKEGRQVLSLWISQDDGESWSHSLDLAQAPAGRVACYPHGFLDDRRQTLYVTCDTYQEQFLLKMPYGRFL